MICTGTYKVYFVKKNLPKNRGFYLAQSKMYKVTSSKRVGWSWTFLDYITVVCPKIHVLYMQHIWAIFSKIKIQNTCERSAIEIQ